MMAAELPQIPLGPVDVFGVFGVIFGAYLLVRVVTFVVSELSERTIEHRITVKMILPVFKALVYAAVVYYVLGPFLSLTPSQLLAISGLIGAAIGFGIKELFSSLVGGLIIIVERPYKIGDTIEFGDKTDFGDYYGEVTDIGIRATTLRTADDTHVVVPNDAVFKTSVANTNEGRTEMMVRVEFHVASDADLERASQIVEEALVTSRYVYVSEDRQVLVLEKDEPYYRTLLAKAYVNDTRNEFAFKSDVTRRVRREFERQGIEKPRSGDLDRGDVES